MMASWPELEQKLAAACVERMGESVTLPSSEVTGIFFPKPATPAGLLGSEVGLTMRLSQQEVPMLHLIETDAEGLSEGDTLTVRGREWEITRIDSDGQGIAVLDLRPAPSEAPDPTRRWR
jgi:hypothetical protein